MASGDHPPDQGGHRTSCARLEREVVDAIYATIEPLLPEPPTHPLGCHRPRVSDRLCFWGLLIRLTTGSSWVDIEAILEHRVSDTTLRSRRDEWIAAGVFDEFCDHAIAAFDRIIGLDLSEVAIDGSLHKAPYGGEGTGSNPTDRRRHGWKWSVGVDRHGIPLGWSIDGANRSDVRMLAPTLDAIAAASWTAEIETIHLDRGYDYPKIRRQLVDAGLTDHITQHRRQPSDHRPKSITLAPKLCGGPATSGLSEVCVVVGQLFERGSARWRMSRRSPGWMVAACLIVSHMSGSPACWWTR